MATSWLRWFSRIAIAMAVIVAALALLWALSWLWWRLSPQWDSQTVMAIAIVAMALVAGIWWLWWWLPQRQVARLALKIRDPKARADTEDNFRKTVGQALGGAAVLIGAGAAYLQFTQQQQASHDLLISNQVAKGFEQLASDKIAMRLGGIYGLEGVMNTSEQYHQPVLEALCAFVRDGTIGMIVNDERPATDIQAALTVIGRRTSGPGRINLFRANIISANLNGANLRGANLRRANLSGAFLVDADLSGSPHMKLDDTTNLIDADLSHAYLFEANLSHAELSGANLSGAHLEGANVAGANLFGANLSGALGDPNLSGANLSATDLRHAELSGANLSYASVAGANLSDADLRNVRNLTQAQLDLACGAKVKLPAGMMLQPCPEKPVAPPLNPKATP